MTPTRMPRDVIVGLGAAVCDEADLQGSVSFGSQAIAHPRCAVWAIAAPVVIGDRTILEDHARLENADQEQQQSGSATVMTIGSDNIFEAGCIVRSASVGNGNLFEPKSETLPGSKIGSNCVIGSGVVIGRDEVVPDNAVIVCIRDPSAPCGTRIVRQQKPHLSAARASLTTKYITTFLDAKSPYALAKNHHLVPVVPKP